MNALTVAFVSAMTALTAAVLSPMVSLLVTRMQIRATVISNNRERWIEALRDAVAEYVAVLLTASMVKQAAERDPLQEVREHRDLLPIVERVVMMKSKIMLMINPSDQRYAALCEKVEASYELLASDSLVSVPAMRAQANEVTRLGAYVLRTEWARVKRGD